MKFKWRVAATKLYSMEVIFSCFLWQDTFTEEHRLIVNTSGIDQLFIHSNH